MRYMGLVLVVRFESLFDFVDFRTDFAGLVSVVATEIVAVFTVFFHATSEQLQLQTLCLQAKTERGYLFGSHDAGTPGSTKIHFSVQPSLGAHGTVTVIFGGGEHMGAAGGGAKVWPMM